ncbi:MAG: AFG1 family ATPase [Alphaproteobacteria bacterium]|nr:AFG1 family ATPase [Alphaproteobacteria bacterium]
MGLIETYEAGIASGEVKADAAQLPVVRALNALAEKLEQQPKAKSIFARLRATPNSTPQGLYLWGEVGRGKTFMMDRFYQSLNRPTKQRIHFHAFMQGIHAKRATLRSDDVISDIANDITKNGQVLCLDEMQISDIADAMIIGRLFEALAARGVVIITTSNLPPDGLYKDGLNRHLFQPFIAWMNTHLQVIRMGDGADYRLGRLAARPTYLVGQNATEMTTIWNELTDYSAGESIEIEVLGRKLKVPCAAHGCARFSFAELCENPLGAPDYLALAKNFRTILIDDVPTLKASQRNEAKRFILVIDTMYDAKTRLVIAAAAPPEKLYPTGPHKAEFARTISRLQEMQSASWWKSDLKDQSDF